MSERYFITGIQLGLMIAHSEQYERQGIADEIIDKQFIGNSQGRSNSGDCESVKRNQHPDVNSTKNEPKDLFLTHGHCPSCHGDEGKLYFSESSKEWYCKNCKKWTKDGKFDFSEGTQDELTSKGFSKAIDKSGLRGYDFSEDTQDERVCKKCGKNCNTEAWCPDCEKCEDCMGKCKEDTNPAHHCLTCNKYLGFRGFCSEECHHKHYDPEDIEKTYDNHTLFAKKKDLEANKSEEVKK